MQISESQEPPDETLSGSYYARQIPQLAGKTEHLLRCRSTPATRPVIYQCRLHRLCVCACVVFVVTEISSVCELITKPKDSKVVFQFDVFFGARMGISPGSPGPKSRMLSDASEADTTKADLSSSDYWVLMRPWSSSLLLSGAERTRWGSRALPFVQLRGIFLGSRLPRFFPDQMVVSLCTAMITVPHCTL